MEIYATDVHCLLARLPNPTTRGTDGKRSPGLGTGHPGGNRGLPLPGLAACILPVQQGLNEQRGSCSDTLVCKEVTL